MHHWRVDAAGLLSEKHLRRRPRARWRVRRSHHDVVELIAVQCNVLLELLVVLHRHLADLVAGVPTTARPGALAKSRRCLGGLISVPARGCRAPAEPAACRTGAVV